MYQPLISKTRPRAARASHRLGLDTEANSLTPGNGSFGLVERASAPTMPPHGMSQSAHPKAVVGPSAANVYLSMTKRPSVDNSAKGSAPAHQMPMLDPINRVAPEPGHNCPYCGNNMMAPSPHAAVPYILQ